MEIILGTKSSLAVGIDIVKFEPHLWGRSTLFINNSQIGDFNDNNVLAPFIWSLMRIAMEHDNLWLPEFKGLTCKETFDQIHPFFIEPEKFYDLSEVDQESLVKFDKFLFQFGENFDNCLIHPIIKNGTCMFLWLADLSNVDKANYHKFMKCFKVPLREIQVVYRQICHLIPIQYWPTDIKKLD